MGLPVGSALDLASLAAAPGSSPAGYLRMHARGDTVYLATSNGESVVAALYASSIVSSATPTPSVGSLTRNQYSVTALAANATFGAPTGLTPINGTTMLIRIKDVTAARTLAWNAIYRAIGVTLPTTTVLTKTLYVGCTYNSADTKWDVIAVAQEA